MQYIESPLSLTLLSLLSAWFVGNMLSTKWQLLRRRKELCLETTHHFYECYGEFFTIWKIWNQRLDDEDRKDQRFVEPKTSINEVRSELISRSSAMEGRIEAALLKLASEVCLTDNDRYNLGQLRQAFQMIRYCVRYGMRIPISADLDDLYLRLKGHSVFLAVFLSGPKSYGLPLFRTKPRAPSFEDALQSWKEITSNEHENPFKTILRKNARIMGLR